MLLAKVLGAIGRTLITAGVLILLFVAYQLWGTGISAARSQDRLEDEFEAFLDEAGPVSTTTSGTVTTTTLATAPPSTAPPLLETIERGDPVGRIVIPDIGVDWIMVEGVNLTDLKKGPGHYPDTPLPGQAGNAAIAGHRTTYGAPFANVDQLEVGDQILVSTIQGNFTYEVSETVIVKPSQVDVLEEKGDNRLTLTTCHPKYSARERMIIIGQLRGQPLARNPTAVALEPGEASLGLSGERAPKLPAILWGLACALVWFLAWAVGRKWRKWPSYAIALPFFLVLLFVFFENFSRLLPANY